MTSFTMTAADETFEQASVRLSRRRARRVVATGLRCVDFACRSSAAGAPAGVASGTLVEVCGPSGCGKSRWLMHAAAEHAALTRGRCVYVDLDSRLPPFALPRMVHALLAARDGAAPSIGAVNAALQRVRVVRPRTQLQLLADLELARAWLSFDAPPATPACNADAGGLVLWDSSGAWYWLERGLDAATKEAAGLATTRALHGLLEAAGAAALVAKPHLVFQAGGLPREYAPPAWQRLVACRIELAPGGGPGGDLPTARILHPPEGPGGAGWPVVQWGLEPGDGRLVQYKH